MLTLYRDNVYHVSSAKPAVTLTQLFAKGIFSECLPVILNRDVWSIVHLFFVERIPNIHLQCCPAVGCFYLAMSGTAGLRYQ